MTEIAFFRMPDGRAWIGEGPFELLAAPAGGGACFYVNDFDLTDPLPWKKPARLHEVSAGNIAAWAGDDAGPLRVQWEKPRTEWFKMAFRRIRREVLAGRLAKMVPVMAEKGARLSGSTRQLLRSALAAPSNLWGYGFCADTHGFIGATPEQLFHIKGATLETMALAGTAKPGDKNNFLSDVKEIQEHELVAGYVEERLGSIGKAERGERTVLETSGLLHFQTKLSARLSRTVAVNELITLLHPTPAVGCLPRTDEWLAKLREYRALLKAPGFFGAPFGFSKDGEHHLVVAIRGVSWDGDTMQLPSGCGIVGGSAFDHEWRELRLKREAVTRLFGL